MGDNVHDRKFLLQHQCCRILLDVNRGAIAAQDFFFVDPNRRRRKLDLSNRVIRGKEQNASAGARRRQGISYKPRMRYSHQHGISPPPFGLGPHCIHKLTICWVKGLYRAKC